MRHIPIAEFKDKVSEIVAAAEAGEDIVITRHGRAAARLISARDSADFIAQRRAVLDALRAHREGLRQAGVSVTRDEILEWRAEGRR